MKRILVVAALIGGVAVMPPSAQTPAAGPAPRHATAVTRLLIANAMVIYGNARPAFGPVDVLVEGGLIARVGTVRRTGPDAVQVDAVIDGTGKYVMPGMINTHMHWHEERMPGIPHADPGRAQHVPGVGHRRPRAKWAETSRRPGNGVRRERPRRRSSRPASCSTRARTWGGTVTPAEIRAGVREAKANGADGLEVLRRLDRDQLEALLDEAQEGRAPDDDAHRRRGDDGVGLRRARRELHRALLRRRRRRARGHPELPP